MAAQGAAYMLLSDSVVTTQYTASGLTAGTTYSFKVETKNQHGFGASSTELTLLSAFVPNPPITVTTAN